MVTGMIAGAEWGRGGVVSLLDQQSMEGVKGGDIDLDNSGRQREKAVSDADPVLNGVRVVEAEVRGRKGIRQTGKRSRQVQVQLFGVIV